MSVSFERRNDELILCYSPAMGISDITKRLSMDEEILIKRTFLVTKSMLREFCIIENKSHAIRYTRIANFVC